MKLPLALAAAGIPLLAAAAAAWPFSGVAAPEAVETPGLFSRAQGLIASWPEPSRDLAEALLQVYGAPDTIEAARLSWKDKRPWSRIVVDREALDPARPTGLLQSVAYDVPLRRWRALESFGRGADYDPVARELIARTDREDTNILALNLADEVIRGRRTPEEARAFYDQTLALSLSGKSSPYMRRLLFRR